MLSSLTLTLAMMASSPAGLDRYLERAIERGVPLYNNGDPAACAAVYATALEAAAGWQGWADKQAEPNGLSFELQRAAALDDPSEQAWAYRRLIDRILAGEEIAMPELAAAAPLYDFSDLEQLERWRIVVDGVMGGRSTGALRLEDDVMVFTGETSLRNNGGCSSIRAPLPGGARAGYDALRIRVRGDGRTYILGAATRGGRGNSYWARFETTADEWVTVTVPVTEMVRQFFGNPLPGQLDPARVRGLEFYIYDKKEGPFRLEVAQIEAVQAGTG